MEGRRLKKCAALLLSLCLLLGGAGAAEGQGQAAFRVGQPDKDGYFTVELRIRDAVFNVFQFTLGYDPALVQPVRPSDGLPAETFGDFAQKAPTADWLASVGTGLDPEQGRIGFTGYAAPGSGSITADGAGVETWVFHFRQLGETEGRFRVLEGLLADNGAGQGSTALFQYPDGEETVSIPPPAAPADTAMSREERLRGTLIFQAGNRAASAEGRRMAIYPGESGGTPYEENGELFVPLRFAAELLGAEVAWDNDSRKAVISGQKHALAVKIGAQNAEIDGKEVYLSAPPALAGDEAGDRRTMVPASALALALDLDVTWEPGSRTLVLAPAHAPWDQEGALEQGLMAQTLLLLSPLVGSFVE